MMGYVHRVRHLVDRAMIESLEKRVYELEDKIEELNKLLDLVIDSILESGTHDHLVETLEKKLGKTLYRR